MLGFRDDDGFDSLTLAQIIANPKCLFPKRSASYDYEKIYFERFQAVLNKLDFAPELISAFIDAIGKDHAKFFDSQIIFELLIHYPDNAELKYHLFLYCQEHPEIFFDKIWPAPSKFKLFGDDIEKQIWFVEQLLSRLIDRDGDLIRYGWENLRELYRVFHDCPELISRLLKFIEGVVGKIVLIEDLNSAMSEMRGHYYSEGSDFTMPEVEAIFWLQFKRIRSSSVAITAPKDYLSRRSKPEDYFPDIAAIVDTVGSDLERKKELYAFFQDNINHILHCSLFGKIASIQPLVSFYKVIKEAPDVLEWLFPIVQENFLNFLAEHQKVNIPRVIDGFPKPYTQIFSGERLGCFLNSYKELFGHDRAKMYWLHDMLMSGGLFHQKNEIENFQYAGIFRIFVDYPELLADWRGFALGRLNSFLKSIWDVQLWAEVFKDDAATMELIFNKIKENPSRFLYQQYHNSRDILQTDTYVCQYKAVFLGDRSKIAWLVQSIHGFNEKEVVANAREYLTIEDYIMALQEGIYCPKVTELLGLMRYYHDGLTAEHVADVVAYIDLALKDMARPFVNSFADFIVIVEGLNEDQKVAVFKQFIAHLVYPWSSIVEIDLKSLEHECIPVEFRIAFIEKITENLSLILNEKNCAAFALWDLPRCYGVTSYQKAFEYALASYFDKQTRYSSGDLKLIESPNFSEVFKVAMIDKIAAKLPLILTEWVYSVFAVWALPKYYGVASYQKAFERAVTTYLDKKLVSSGKPDWTAEDLKLIESPNLSDAFKIAMIDKIAEKLPTFLHGGNFHVFALWDLPNYYGVVSYQSVFEKMLRAIFLKGSRYFTLPDFQRLSYGLRHNVDLQTLCFKTLQSRCREFLYNSVKELVAEEKKCRQLKKEAADFRRAMRSGYHDEDFIFTGTYHDDGNCVAAGYYSGSSSYRDDFYGGYDSPPSDDDYEDSRIRVKIPTISLKDFVMTFGDNPERLDWFFKSKIFDHSSDNLCVPCWNTPDYLALLHLKSVRGHLRLNVLRIIRSFEDMIFIQRNHAWERRREAVLAFSAFNRTKDIAAIVFSLKDSITKGLPIAGKFSRELTPDEIIAVRLILTDRELKLSKEDEVLLTSLATKSGSDARFYQTAVVLGFAPRTLLLTAEAHEHRV